MRVALVHDWLTGTRGGEKVLLELALLFPDAPVYTLFHFPGRVPAAIERHEIRTTFLQRRTSPASDYRKLLPLFFAAAETWDLSGFDLVLSSSHCVAKNAKKPAGAVHVCYCHTPVRYLHGQFREYMRSRPWPVRSAARLVRAPLAAWDVATVPRVDAFVANSENVRSRILGLYGRDATVVCPPVDAAFYTPAAPGTPRTGFLAVSALAPYKRLEDAIDVANRRGLALRIAGFGPERDRLRARAGPTVTFHESPSDETLRELYRGAEAFLLPGEEDFGIAPVEALACGTPVIALRRGGVAESVAGLDAAEPTGVFFEEQSADAVVAAVQAFEKHAARIQAAACRRRAELFSAARFRAEFKAQVAQRYAGWRDDVARQGLQRDR